MRRSFNFIADFLLGLLDFRDSWWWWWWWRYAIISRFLYNVFFVFFIVIVNCFILVVFCAGERTVLIKKNI